MSRLLKEMEYPAALVDGIAVVKRVAEHFIEQLFSSACFSAIEQMIHGALPEFSHQVQLFEGLFVYIETHV